MSSSSYYKSLIAQNYSDIKKEEEKINATLSKIAADNGIKFSPLLFFSSVAPTVKSQIKNGITVNDELEKKDDVQTTYTETQNPNEEKVEEIVEVEESEEVNEAIEVVEEEKNNEIFETASEENDEPVINAKSELISADNYLRTRADSEGNVKIDGYSYNVNSHELTDKNNRKIKVDYLLPKNADLSHLNTITVMGGDDGVGVVYNKNDGWNGLENVSSNCLIVSPRRDNKKSYIDYPVASATIFGNLFTGNKNSKNTITGYSAGGGCAVKIAAENPSLYKRVISCNYEPIVVDYNKVGKGKDASHPIGVQLTKDDIQKLVQYDIELTYINCEMDRNISKSDPFSGLVFSESTPALINEVANATNRNPKFHLQFLTNVNGGWVSDNELGSWANNSNCDCISYSNDGTQFANFMGISYDVAKKINGHNGGKPILKYVIEMGC